MNFFKCLVFTSVLWVSLLIGYAENYEWVENVAYYPESQDDYVNSQCRLDLYYPKDRSGFQTVVWFHGGGLRGGTRSVPGPLKEQGIAVVAVSYRLFPKVKSPAYIEDAAASIAWVFKHISEYNGDPKKIFLSGHSAGGYLVSMVGLDRKWLGVHGVSANEVAGVIPFSGHTITHFTVREERGIPESQAIVDSLAPLFHVRKDAPDFLFITGDRELELLGRYEENAYMWRMMKGVGHDRCQLFELEGYNHGNMPLGAYPLLLNYLKDKAR